MAYLGNLLSVVVRRQHCSLLISVPDEFSASIAECWVPRTLAVNVAVVDRDDVLRDGSLVYHSHDGHTQTHTQRERTEEAEESHDVKY